MHEHLNLKDWPFSVSPSEESAKLWVGRKDIKRRMSRLLRGIQRVSASQIVLLWASYGAGKTHLLKHLEWLAREDRPEVIPLFVVTPRGIKSFLDIYRAIIEAAIRAGTVEAAGHDLFSRSGGEPDSDLGRALVRMAMGRGNEPALAASWLKAERVDLRELRNIGITRRLESTADGVDALDRLIKTLQRDGSVKVLLLIDEMQELEELDTGRGGGRKLSECVGGLHKVFDSNTEGLTLVLSFTTGSQASLRDIIQDALFDRSSEVISLPQLNDEEAVEFVYGLMHEWSIDTNQVPKPFTDDAIRTVISKMPKDAGGLSPRSIIKAFDGILREADLDIEAGDIQEIDAAYAVDHLPEELED